MLRHRRPIRFWAALALLLWLAVFGVGVAQACLGAGTQWVHQAPMAEPDSPIEANCHTLCGKSAVSPPMLKWSSDNLHAHAIHVAGMVIAVPMPASAPAPRWLPHPNGVLPAPIPIAFLRLAL